MKFKVDESLPIEVAEKPRAAGHGAVTVVEQSLQGADDSALSNVCRSEERILVTLDLDFSDLRTYPPENFPGFIVFRTRRHDKPSGLRLLERVIPLLDKEPMAHHLWVVEEDRLRIRPGA